MNTYETLTRTTTLTLTLILLTHSPQFTIGSEAVTTGSKNWFVKT